LTSLIGLSFLSFRPTKSATAFHALRIPSLKTVVITKEIGLRAIFATRSQVFLIASTAVRNQDLTLFKPSPSLSNTLVRIQSPTVFSTFDMSRHRSPIHCKTGLTTLL